MKFLCSSLFCGGVSEILAVMMMLMTNDRCISTCMWWELTWHGCVKIAQSIKLSLDSISSMQSQSDVCIVDWTIRKHCLGMLPATWLMTAAMSFTPAQEHGAWLTLLRFSSVGTCTNLGDRAFSAAGPRVWNYLPMDLKQPDLSYRFIFRTNFTDLILDFIACRFLCFRVFFFVFDFIYFLHAADKVGQFCG